MNGIHAAIEGRITEPELKYTPTGQAILQFSVVAYDAKATADTEPEWVRVSVWGDRAEELAPVLKKGAEVYLEGRMRLNKWTDREGAEHSGLAISAWTAQPMGAIGKKAPKRPTAA